MDSKHIEQIREIPKANSANNSKLGKDKKISKASGKPCIYFKDVTCRIPFCELEMCAKCPRGYIYCMDGNPNPLKKMLHKIIGIALFFVAFLGEESLLYELLNKFMPLL